MIRRAALATGLLLVGCCNLEREGDSDSPMATSTWFVLNVIDGDTIVARLEEPGRRTEACGARLVLQCRRISSTGLDGSIRSM